MGPVQDDTGGKEGGLGDTSIADMPPSSVPLVLGANLEVWGVTGDEIIVYSDETAGTLFALPVGSKTPKTIMTGLSPGAGSPDASAATHLVVVRNDVVLIWTGIDENNAGALAAWTSGAVKASPITASSASGFALVTADSAHIGYFDHFNGVAGVADFTLVTPTGTAKTTLVPAVWLGGNCNVTGAVAASSYFLLNHCEATGAATGDGGAPEAGSVDAGGSGPTYLSELSVTTGQRVDLLRTVSADPSGFQVNQPGTQVLASFDPGLELFTLGETVGPGTVIDPRGAGQIAFTPDGAGVVYMNTALSALIRSPLLMPSPSVLQAPFAGFYGLSPDGRFVLGATTFDESGQTDDSDLYLVSATAPTPAIAILTTVNGQPIGDVFTTDSSHVLYEDDSESMPTLNAFDVSGPPALRLGATPLSDHAAGMASPVVVFNDNFNGDDLSAGHGSADLYSVNTSTAAPPMLIASQANADFALTPAKDKVVFVWNVAPGPKSGLYVVPVL
jgi:hypothetical protein